MRLLLTLKNRIADFLRETTAADAFEYVLVVGGVSVVFIALLAAASGIMEDTIDAVCGAIDGIIGGPALSC